MTGRDSRSHACNRLRVLVPLLLATTVSALSADDAFIVAPKRAMASTMTTREVETVPLPNGNLLSFVPMYNDRNQLQSALTIETIKPGNTSAVTAARVNGMHARAIFHAFAPPNYPVPAFLSALAIRFDPPQAQGWGRQLVDVPGDPGSQAGEQPWMHCSENDQVSSFQEMSTDVLAFGWTYSFLGEAIYPHGYPLMWTPAKDYLGYHVPYYELYGAVHDVEGFFASVVGCQFESDTWDDPHTFMAAAEFEYRIGNGPFISTGKKIMEPNGDPGSRQEIGFYWTRSANDNQPYGIFVEPDQAPDFRLHLYGTEHDTFHIGATWSKPFNSIAQR